MKTMLIRRSRRPSQLMKALIFLGIALLAYAVTALGGAKKATVETGKGAELVTQEYNVPEQNLHMISFGAYDTEAEARVEAARYVGRGTAGYIYPASRLFVIAAGYEAREDAQRVAEQLQSAEGIACEVLSVKSEPVCLKITAAQAQIQALDSCDATLREALSELGQLSFALDGANSDYLQVTSRLQDTLDRTALAASSLREDYQLAGDAIGGGYLRLLNAYSSSIRQLLTDSAATTLAFSSRLKYAFLDNRLAYIQFLQGLSGSVEQNGRREAALPSGPREAA